MTNSNIGGVNEIVHFEKHKDPRTPILTQDLQMALLRRGCALVDDAFRGCLQAGATLFRSGPAAVSVHPPGPPPSSEGGTPGKKS